MSLKNELVYPARSLSDTSAPNEFATMFSSRPANPKEFEHAPIQPPAYLRIAWIASAGAMNTPLDIRILSITLPDMSATNLPRIDFVSNDRAFEQQWEGEAVFLDGQVVIIPRGTAFVLRYLRHLKPGPYFHVFAATLCMNPAECLLHPALVNTSVWAWGEFYDAFKLINEIGEWDFVMLQQAPNVLVPFQAKAIKGHRRCILIPATPVTTEANPQSNTQYYPLDRSVDEIRLLRRTYEEGVPTFNFHYVPLDMTRRVLKDGYVAVSGLDSGQTSMLVDGVQIDVQQDLAEFIMEESFFRDAAEETGGRRKEIWIWDGWICVNRQDEREKLHQVKLTKLIFVRAAMIAVWLGSASLSAQDLLMQLDQEHKTRQLGYHQDYSDITAEKIHDNPGKYRALAEIFLRPYFSRVQPTQELMLADLHSTWVYLAR